MPIYEYKCSSCNQRFEVMQRVSDPVLTTCETCGGPVEKLISAPAFQFKGSGWYVTDYARKDGEAKGGDKKGEGDAGGSASESTSEGKTQGESKKEPSGSAGAEKKSETS